MVVAQSLVDVAYSIITKKKKPISFDKLWAEVCEEENIDEENAKSKASYFYTQLMLDGRFVTLGENTWDLRTRHTFDKVHIDMNDVYADDDEIDEGSDDDDDDEEKDDLEKEEAFDDVEDEEIEKPAPEESEY